MVHSEYAIRTLETKNLLFKEYSDDAEKIIRRLVLEAYMGDCYISNNQTATYIYILI